MRGRWSTSKRKNVSSVVMQCRHAHAQGQWSVRSAGILPPKSCCFTNRCGGLGGHSACASSRRWTSIGDSVHTGLLFVDQSCSGQPPTSASTCRANCIRLGQGPISVQDTAQQKIHLLLALLNPSGLEPCCQRKTAPQRCELAGCFRWHARHIICSLWMVCILDYVSSAVRNLALLTPISDTCRPRSCL